MCRHQFGINSKRVFRGFAYFFRLSRRFEHPDSLRAPSDSTRQLQMGIRIAGVGGNRLSRQRYGVLKQLFLLAFFGDVVGVD